MRRESERAAQAAADRGETERRLQPGIRFDTDSECGCVVQTTPNERGDFDGLDSDGVEVLFTVRQVTTIYE